MSADRVVRIVRLLLAVEHLVLTAEGAGAGRADAAATAADVLLVVSATRI